MTDDALLALMIKVDPMTRRIPEGIRAIAQGIEAAERERWQSKAHELVTNYRRNHWHAEANGLESLFDALGLTYSSSG